jgi:hypothetical protein
LWTAWAAVDNYRGGSVRAATVTGMTKPPLADVPVRTAEDLTQRWEQLLDPSVFSARSLWLTWLDGGLMLPVVIPVDDVPAAPDRLLLANVARASESIAESYGLGTPHVAIALCRPGRVKVTKDDEAWERGLAEAFRTTKGTWSLHLAAGGTVVPMVDLPD